MDKITSDEIVKGYSSQVLEWRQQGMGRRRCAEALAKLTGRHCTPAAMAIAIDRLGANAAAMVPPPPRVKFETDLTDEDTERPIMEIITERIDASERKMRRAKRHNRVLTMPAAPVGIMLFGDPHVDNEGCDWGTLFDHVKMVEQVEGVVAACVGDMQDNWIGRLARLYAESSITASDGWRLSEWMLEKLQWIAIVGGNHDAWAHVAGVDPMKWLTEKHGVTCYAPDEIRITLAWKDRPDLEPIIWVLRHDFRGRSWFHPTHGPHKEAMLDGKAHLFTAGHLHEWGMLSGEQRHGRCTVSLRVRGYKRADSYAREGNFIEQEHGEACLIIIDPFAVGPGRVQVFWDIQRGIDVLKVLRNTVRTAIVQKG